MTTPMGLAAPQTARHPNFNFLWATSVWETARANGVTRVVISPGSRSAVLSLAAHASGLFDLVVLPDERAAAFFALGEAIASGEPVALVCTSGTAAANYLPAVVEAGLARVPLLVVTADRPPAMRGMGAAQTIDQVHLYGHHVRRFAELPLPAPGALGAMMAQVGLALVAARQVPQGPVHLNAPFEEPLSPIEKDVEAVALLAARRPAPPVFYPARQLATEEAIEAAAGMLRAARRPLVVAGSHAAECGGAALVALAARLGAPLLADIGADLRGLPVAPGQVLAHADAFLRAPDFAAPDLVLRVGGAPTAKGLITYLARHQAPTLVLQPDLMGREADVGAVLVVVGDVTDAATRLGTRVTHACEPGWLERWTRAEAMVASGLDDLPLEVEATRRAVAAMPPGSRLCLSNSLPIRHADTYLDAHALAGRRVHTFRGANGIDGVTSQALGIARASGEPTLLVTGDLAALHDLGGLLAARELATPFVLLVLNNDGGGIFSTLPIAKAAAPAAHEALFGTPHGRTFASAAELFGLPYTRRQDAAGVGEAVAAGLCAAGVSVVELDCRRADTAREQQAFLARWEQMGEHS